MSLKICQVLFSANRPEYLARTLATQQRLDFAGCEVHKILFDDFPLGRNDEVISRLAGAFGYNEVYLHSENLSLSATWTEFWLLIKGRDYDYVWHQEDDVEILEPIRILDLVALLRADPTLSQIVLRRQPWYKRDLPPAPLSSDRLFGRFRYEVDNNKSIYFSPLASLYSMERVRFDYFGWFKRHYPHDRFHEVNLNEGLIGKALLEQWRDGRRPLSAGHLKNAAGGPLCYHFGEYSQGLKMLPTEPGAEIFAGLDPEKKYHSKDNKPYQS